MGRFSQFTILVSLLAVIALLTSCNSSQVYGKIKKISKSKITIETGSYKSVSNSKESAATAAEAEEQAEDRFMTDGGSADYALSAEINSADLTEGTCVKLTLEEETVVAIETLLRPKAETESSKATDPQLKEAKQSALLLVDDEKTDASSKTYSTHKSNANTILVGNRGALKMSGSSLTKSGDTTDTTKSRLHGLNAVLTASEGSSAVVDNTTLTSSGAGASGIFATGKDTSITAKKVKISTSGNASGGLDATYGGSIQADGSDIITKGADSPAIAADEQQGAVKAMNTTVNSEGQQSPCIRAKGRVRAMWVNGGASQSPIAEIENNGCVTLDSCILRGAGESGISFRGSDAESGEGFLNTADSQLTTTCNGPMLSVDSGALLAVMENTNFYYSSGIFAKVTGELSLKGINQMFCGSIACEPDSSVKMNLTKNTILEGAVNEKHTAKFASMALDSGSIWKVKGNSYLDVLTNTDKQCGNIESNGHTIYYDSSQKANAWLKGKVLSLSGGGKLTPVN